MCSCHLYLDQTLVKLFLSIEFISLLIRVEANRWAPAGTELLVLVTLANALEGSIWLPLGISIGDDFLWAKGLDNKMLFSTPFCWTSHFLLNLLNGSVPLSSIDSSWLLRRLLDFNLLVSAAEKTLLSFEMGFGFPVGHDCSTSINCWQCSGGSFSLLFSNSFSSCFTCDRRQIICIIAEMC